MIVINLLSPTGGAGRSSVAVQLAHLLHERGRGVLLLQSDPINQLAFQVGKAHGHTSGWAQVLQGHMPWAHALHRTTEGLRYMPMGQLSAQQNAELADDVLSQPERLQALFDHPELEQDLIVLVDLPRWPTVWNNVWLQVSDLNLVILTPDANAMLAINPLTEDLLQGRGASYFLVNRFESSHVLHLDVWTLAKSKLGHRLLPFYMHQDQSLPESMAAGLPLHHHAPASSLSDDFQKLANWLDLELA